MFTVLFKPIRALYSCIQNQSKHSISYFDDCPNEIVLEIFQSLNAAELATCSLVCKKFYKIANTNSLWRNLFERDYFSLGTPSTEIQAKEEYRRWWKGKLQFECALTKGSRGKLTAATEDASLGIFAIGSKFLQILGDTGLAMPLQKLNTKWDTPHIINSYGVFWLDVKSKNIVQGTVDDSESPKPHLKITTAIEYRGQIATGSNEGELRLWNPKTLTSEQLLPPNNQKMGALLGTPYGIVCGTSRGLIRVWNASSTSESQWNTPVENITQLLEVNGRVLIESSGSSIYIWDPANGVSSSVFWKGRFPYYLFKFDENILGAVNQNYLQAWKIEKQKCTETFEYNLCKIPHTISTMLPVGKKIFFGTPCGQVFSMDFTQLGSPNFNQNLERQTQALSQRTTTVNGTSICRLTRVSNKIISFNPFTDSETPHQYKIFKMNDIPQKILDRTKTSYP